MTAAFILTGEVVELLGVAPSTFYDRRAALEATGFPKPDPVMRRYLRADVEAWIQSRRRVPDPDSVQMGASDLGINFDAL